MTVNYTTNLALGQPVTGTESGTWGDDVNNAVTSYLDIAIAGGLAITVTTTDVTLTITQGTSVATNIGSTTAQYAILNVSGAMTAARNLIVPSSSRQYVINNACTGGFLLTVKGSATTGVTLVNGEKAHVFWNGTDYSKLSNTPGGAGTFSSITNTGLTSGRVVFSTTGGLETDSANLTFSGSALAVTGTLSATGTLSGGTSGTGYSFSGSAPATSLALDASGNLKIGSPTSVANPLNIQTNSAADSIAIVGRAADGISTVNFFANNGTTQYGFIQSTSSGLKLSSSTTTQATLDSSGNLLVGTTTAVGRLTVTSAASQEYGTFDAPTSGYAFFRLRYNGTSYGNLGQGNAVVTGGAATDFGLNATTNMLFATGGSTEKMRLDSSGNLIVGATSTRGTYKLDIRSNTGIAIGANATFFGTIDYSAGTGLLSLAAESGGGINFLSGSTERARIDSSGNLGIGVTPSAVSPGKAIEVGFVGNILQGYNTTTFYIGQNWYYGSADKFAGNGRASVYVQNAGAHSWQTSTISNVSGAGAAASMTTVMTLDSSGNLIVGNGNTSLARSTNTAVEVLTVSAIAATATNQYGVNVDLRGDPNNTGNYFYAGRGNITTDRVVLRSNGGIANYSANNVNLSDIRTKKDIADAPTYLDRICAIPVRTFLYNDQTDTDLNLGVIAQEVELQCPELVSNDGFGKTPDDGIPLKAIYQTDLQYALMKCIQEQQALITQLTARITALETT